MSSKKRLELTRHETDKKRKLVNSCKFLYDEFFSWSKERIAHIVFSKWEIFWSSLLFLLLTY